MPINLEVMAYCTQLGAMDAEENTDVLNVHTEGIRQHLIPRVHNAELIIHAEIAR